MALYTPKFSETTFKGGKNIIASEHLEWIKGGATLDATAFATGYHDVGKLIARNTTSGKFEPFSVVAGYDTFSILNEDFTNDGVNDLIAGVVMVRGSVYEQKLADTVPAEFKAATPLIQYINHN